MSYIYQKPLDGESIGVVFGSFAPLHQGHLDLIMRAKKENDGGCIVIVCGFDGDKGEPIIPHTKRYRYVREFFADDDMVAVYPINDTKIGIDKYPNGWEGWLKEFNNIYSQAVEMPFTNRKWYVAEQEYYDGLIERHENAVLVDRTQNLISGTMIRENPIKHWNKIAKPFRRAFSHNILITGTASEGKSTLVQDLGKYFSTAYSHEEPRNHMIEKCVHDTELDGLDFINFIMCQHNLNRNMIDSDANRGVFFADTDSLITKMYASMYADDDNFRMDKLDFALVGFLADYISSKCKWDKIFLITPHSKFVDDNTRYMGHSGDEERQKLCGILIDSLKNNGLSDKITILNGDYYDNFLSIKNYVESEVLINE